ncbi:MAG: hypothetical protein Q8N06_00460 [Hydrogenophaga sp.]|uniref:hypothetical protein n=1 Tax=Polaromonas sp. TaxID=1869339 RepID=UPI002730CA6E|nr:hypothetical protein [Polaromonas sp.]MDP3163908.1 hypothetical protein [Hydrogenophaga sp.]
MKPIFAPLTLTCPKSRPKPALVGRRRSRPVGARAGMPAGCTPAAGRPGNERERQGAQHQVRIGGVPSARAPAGRSSAEHMTDAWVI